MARLFGVSTSGYYAWLIREPSRRICSDAQLLARIRTLHASSRGTYGAPRIHAQLAREGVHVGRKRVARLMRMAGLCGASRGRWPRTTRPRAGARRAPDLVRRHFSADAVNVLWVADATYVPTDDLGSPVPFRSQGPPKNRTCEFSRIRLEHRVKRRADAGLAATAQGLRKPSRRWSA
jgi:transposase InsO family protein